MKIGDIEKALVQCMLRARNLRVLHFVSTSDKFKAYIRCLEYVATSIGYVPEKSCLCGTAGGLEDSTSESEPETLGKENSKSMPVETSGTRQFLQRSLRRFLSLRKPDVASQKPIPPIVANASEVEKAVVSDPGTARKTVTDARPKNRYNKLTANGIATDKKITDSNPSTELKNGKQIWEDDDDAVVIRQLRQSPGAKRRHYSLHFEVHSPKSRRRSLQSSPKSKSQNNVAFVDCYPDFAQDNCELYEESVEQTQKELIPSEELRAVPTTEVKMSRKPEYGRSQSLRNLPGNYRALIARRRFFQDLDKRASSCRRLDVTEETSRSPYSQLENQNDIKDKPSLNRELMKSTEEFDIGVIYRMPNSTVTPAQFERVPPVCQNVQPHAPCNNQRKVSVAFPKNDRECNQCSESMYDSRDLNGSECVLDYLDIEVRDDIHGAGEKVRADEKSTDYLSAHSDIPAQNQRVKLPLQSSKVVEIVPYGYKSGPEHSDIKKEIGQNQIVGEIPYARDGRTTEKVKSSKSPVWDAENNCTPRSVNISNRGTKELKYGESDSAAVAVLDKEESVMGQDVDQIRRVAQRSGTSENNGRSSVAAQDIPDLLANLKRFPGQGLCVRISQESDERVECSNDQIVEVQTANIVDRMKESPQPERESLDLICEVERTNVGSDHNPQTSEDALSEEKYKCSDNPEIMNVRSCEIDDSLLGSSLNDLTKRIQAQPDSHDSGISCSFSPTELGRSLSVTDSDSNTIDLTSDFNHDKGRKRMSRRQKRRKEKPRRARKRPSSFPCIIEDKKSCYDFKGYDEIAESADEGRRGSFELYGGSRRLRRTVSDQYDRVLRSDSSEPASVVDKSPAYNKHQSYSSEQIRPLSALEDHSSELRTDVVSLEALPENLQPALEMVTIDTDTSGEVETSFPVQHPRIQDLRSAHPEYDHTPPQDLSWDSQIPETMPQDLSWDPQLPELNAVLIPGSGSQNQKEMKDIGCGNDSVDANEICVDKVVDQIEFEGLKKNELYECTEASGIGSVIDTDSETMDMTSTGVSMGTDDASVFSDDTEVDSLGQDFLQYHDLSQLLPDHECLRTISKPYCLTHTLAHGYKCLILLELLTRKHGTKNVTKSELFLALDGDGRGKVVRAVERRDVSTSMDDVSVLRCISPRARASFHGDITVARERFENVLEDLRVHAHHVYGSVSGEELDQSKQRCILSSVTGEDDRADTPSVAAEDADNQFLSDLSLVEQVLDQYSTETRRLQRAADDCHRNPDTSNEHRELLEEVRLLYEDIGHQILTVRESLIAKSRGQTETGQQELSTELMQRMIHLLKEQMFHQTLLSRMAHH